MWGLFALVLGEYLINSTADFQRLGEVADSQLRLTTDLDFAGVSGYVPQALGGSFDGGNHTIANLRVDKAEVDGGSLFYGVFGRVCAGAQVSDLFLRNVTVEARPYAAGVDAAVFVGIVAAAGPF